MAEILIRYYEHVKSVKGLQGAMALASATKIPSTKAAMEADSHENIRIFRDAVERITEQPAPNF